MSLKLRQVTTSLFFIYSVLLLGVIFTLWTSRLVYEREQVEHAREIDQDMFNFTQNLEVELISSAEILNSVSSLVTTFKDLNYNEFQKFTKNLCIRKKGLLLLEWQPKVKEIERDAFILKVRKLGLENFQLLEPDESGHLIKARPRDEHFPVLYAACTQGANTSIGLDLAWSSERMASKFEARDAAEPRASGTFQVLMTKGTQQLPLGFAITIPVFKNNDTPKSLLERREKLEGFLAAVFYIEELIIPHWNKINPKNLNLKITDIFGKNTFLKKTVGHPSQMVRRKIINVFGRQWEVEITATENYHLHNSMEEIVMAPIIILVLIFILFLFLLLNRKNTLELLKTKNDLNKALVDVEAASRAKTIFLANMSHEIRTPMNAILGFGELIKDEEDKATRDKFVESMENSGQHLLEIIKDILDLSRLEESKLKLNKKLFNLGELIKQVNEIISTQYQKEEIQYIQNVDHCQGQNIIADPVRIKQILINLLSNSFKFTQHGKIILSCERIPISENKFDIVFIVEDTGKGISPEYLKHLFEPFSQEDITFTRPHGGTGLGLSIVKRLVKLMDGNIQVESELNKGATFKVTLPVEEYSIYNDDHYEMDRVEKVVNMKTSEVKILIAEDNEESRYLLNIFLKDEPYQIDFVQNGQELLEQFSKKSYELILTDIQMPIMDGLEATKKLRQMGVAIPILAISAYVMPEEKEKALMTGINDVLGKPFHKAELLAFIDKNLLKEY